MTIFIVYSDSVEFTKSNDMYLSPCIQAVFTDQDDAITYCAELTGRMDSGYYAHEEYPYIKHHEVREGRKSIELRAKYSIPELHDEDDDSFIQTECRA